MGFENVVITTPVQACYYLGLDKALIAFPNGISSGMYIFKMLEEGCYEVIYQPKFGSFVTYRLNKINNNQLVDILSTAMSFCEIFVLPELKYLKTKNLSIIDCLADRVRGFFSRFRRK